MSILVKDDDVIIGAKANACHGYNVVMDGAGVNKSVILMSYFGHIPIYL